MVKDLKDKRKWKAQVKEVIQVSMGTSSSEAVSSESGMSSTSSSEHDDEE